MTSSRVRVAILDDYQHLALRSADFSVLAGRAEIVCFADHVADPVALVNRLIDFDVVIAMRERTPFPASVLMQLERLQLLVTTGPLNASIDLQAAGNQGVTVAGTRNTDTGAAELTWALLLALVRRVPQEDAAVRSGRWQTGIGRELSGSTLGLIGLGRLGQRVARYASAFDMHVIAWSQNLTPARTADLNVTAVSKTELFERADVVSVHVRQSDRTVGLVGVDELHRLGPDGLLVNTSRGPIVDLSALVQALSSGRIAGAALDVFDIEPIPAGHPLLTTPNTVLSPHIGYATRQLYGLFYRDAIEDVLSWLDGCPVRVLTERR